MSDPVVVERLVKAAPEAVFSFFTDARRWLRWQGVDATIEPRPGGAFRVNVQGDGYATGVVLEVDPPRRFVFTWGWEMADNPVPPGSTTVEIELLPDPAGTLVRLTHRDLPDSTIPLHRQGWTHYVERLALVAADGDAGADPWIVRRT
jgi:uncharacterized protein YndB with AHSA1/START domain